MIRIIGNILWFVLGGFFMALGWLFFGLIAFITIVGIPWGKSSFVIAKFSLFPFGQTAIARDVLSYRKDVGTGVPGLIGNIVWFVFAGLWLAIGHFTVAIGLFITVIGIPFGIQHLKLAGISVFPIGKTIVSNEVARVARQDHADSAVDRMRGN